MTRVHVYYYPNFCKNLELKRKYCFRPVGIESLLLCETTRLRRGFLCIQSASRLVAFYLLFFCFPHEIFTKTYAYTMERYYLCLQFSWTSFSRSLDAMPVCFFSSVCSCWELPIQFAFCLSSSWSIIYFFFVLVPRCVCVCARMCVKLQWRGLCTLRHYHDMIVPFAYWSWLCLCVRLMTRFSASRLALRKHPDLESRCCSTENCRQR